MNLPKATPETFADIEAYTFNIIVLWATVSEEVERSLSAGTTKLRPQDWKSGDRLWMVEDRLLGRGGHTIGMRAKSAGRPVDQPVDPIGLEAAADLVELLAAIAHQLAGLADVVGVARQLEQRQLAQC